jgi:hypothetical protein
MKIQYKIGNLFDDLPITPKSPIVICHIVNSIGVWGGGFVIPLGNKWPITKQKYLAWERNGYDPERDIYFCLGESQIICVEPNTFVANMVAQDGLISANNPHPIHYVALAKCIDRVARMAHRLRKCETDKVEFICPAFGSLRAGGDWTIIEKLIQESWAYHGYFNINIYTLNTLEQQVLLKKK